MNDTPGRVWLVTGAASGLGRAITVAALENGDSVVATARDPRRLTDLTERHPGRLIAESLDVTDESRFAPVLEAAVKEFGRIDVLVNNAGRGLVGAVEETSGQQLRDLMEVHFFGPVALTRAVLPRFRKQGSGAIVQISSMGGQLSFAGVGAYSAGKFALEGISEALAAEVEPLGIRVLIVEPGAFRTGLQGPGLTMAEALPVYESTAGVARRDLPSLYGNEPGDPAKAAAAIRAALDADRPPLRLVLGGDAVDAVLAHADTVRAEVTAWQEVARSTDFD